MGGPEDKRVQQYLLFIIKSYYQFFLNPILVLKTMVMVSRPNFGHVGYLRGLKWALNEHNSIFRHFSLIFVVFCSFPQCYPIYVVGTIEIQYINDFAAIKQRILKRLGFFEGPRISVKAFFRHFFLIFAILSSFLQCNRIHVVGIHEIQCISDFAAIKWWVLKHLGVFEGPEWA